MDGPNTPSYTSITASSHLNFEGICSSGWLPLNSILFHLANIFLLLSYFATTSHYGAIYLRICLMLGSLLFSLWGWIILCALDTLLWNSFFTVINLLHSVILIYQLRPIGFNTEMEQVYKELFKPMKISKHSFKKLISCMKEVRTLKPQDTFCVEKKSRLNQLSLVLSGRLVVTQSARILHVVSGMQFLDSAEWFGVASSDLYQVTITALTESRVMLWRKDKLQRTLHSDTHLRAVLDTILGRDVVKKLLLANDGATINGTALFPPLPLGLSTCAEESETTTLLPPHMQASKKKKREIIDAETTV